ncbi:hypothetical protein BH09ACT1_BH09ACT1_19930 [soil metagenome]
MLFDVAALYASGALTGVSEAFGVHEVSTQISALVITADPSAQSGSGVDLTGGGTTATASGSSISSAAITSAPLDPKLLTALRGSDLFVELTLEPASEISTFAAENPKSIKSIAINPPSAVAVSGLWADTPAKTQKALITSAPELVGNLEGVPFAVRDQANRLYLDRTIAALTKKVDAGVGRAALVNEKHHLNVLKQVKRTLVRAKGDSARHLLTLDTSGEARAAVAVGDLSKADYVSYLVPGMFFTVQGQMYDWTVIAQDLQHEQTSWIKRLSATDVSMKGKTAATVSWIGYSTPGVLDIASLKKADEGATYLGDSITGMKATRAASEPYVTLVTHSYGSTAAMIELAKGGVSVDALAIVGSPGSAAQKASQLAVTNDNVYVGEAALDPIVNTAFYGSDPGTASFGAKKMDVAGGVDAVTHKKLTAAVGHLGYFDAGSAAMRNFALIGLGEGSLVTDGSTADATRTVAGK